MTYVQATTAQTVTIPINTALSGAFRFGNFSHGILLMPAAWDVADIAFRVGKTKGGVFIPLYGLAGSIIEVDGPVANRAYPLPNELAGAPYVQLWSETSGSGVNQTAARTIEIVCKP